MIISENFESIMNYLPQEAIKELFRRVSQRYFKSNIYESNSEISKEKQLNKFAREFIKIQKNLSDKSREKFLCLYFIGSIRYNQEQYDAAHKWLTKAKQVSPDNAYIFTDMYAGCVYILLSRKNRYIDAHSQALTCFFRGIDIAKSKNDQETYQRLKERCEYFFQQKFDFC